MSRPLSNAEMVALQIDTNYLNQGIPLGSSMVVNWQGTYVLIYHSPSAGYFTTDISDLPQSTIKALAEQTPEQGVLYYLTVGIQDTLKDAAESVISLGGTTAEISQNVASAIGNTLGALISPVIQPLTIPLIVLGLVLVFYYLPKRS